MAQPHPHALRFPARSDDLAWYRTYAEEIGLTLNAALILGLREHRAAVEAARATTQERTDHDHHQPVRLPRLEDRRYPAAQGAGSDRD
ncbi:MAG TPA: hypothetical protein VNV62_20600 [Trebonia sp.]|nr:hypothetical protein [Trebonia sp.]